MKTALGLLIPFIGTVAGAAMVFFLRRDMSQFMKKALLGFASGVMIAASVWSLLIPAIEMARESSAKVVWLPAAVGFALGIAFLLALDHIIPHLHVDSDSPEGIKKTKMTRGVMLILAVTLHNIPEGMAVGVVFAAVIGKSASVTFASAFALAIGIAIQNFPEGAIISMPLLSSGISKRRAFLYGVLSGVVEPLGALLTILLTGLITPILPYILAFAAGAMIYVVVEELIPDAHEGDHSDVGTIAVALGFLLMMILDVALG